MAYYISGNVASYCETTDHTAHRGNLPMESNYSGTLAATEHLGRQSIGSEGITLPGFHNPTLAPDFLHELANPLYAEDDAFLHELANPLYAEDDGFWATCG